MCCVYTKTIIHLSICVYWGIAPETEDGGAAIPHYSLRFRRIIVNFDFKITCLFAISAQVKTDRRFTWVN